MLLIIFLILSSVTSMPHADSVIIGRRESCINEGEEVKVNNIDDSGCFHCVCKNGFVECRQGCPNTDGCFQLLEKSHNACCNKCKGCIYAGTEYASGTEWTDPLDPCRVLRCEAGVVTESDMECYTPCDHPLPPRSGQCCPTCVGCRINGQRVAEECAVTIPEDPCLKCQCSSGQMTCSKRACPVLHCPPTKQFTPANECCPQCVGTRTLYETSSRSGCILLNAYHKQEVSIKLDSGCTKCKCIGNGTSVCKRITCPVLLCPREQQKTNKGECCPHCPPVEEVRTTCSVGGKTYQDGESWQLDPCKSCECQDGEIRCAMETCSQRNAPCPPNHKLVYLPGQCCPKCIENDGVCTVFGDPHYKTFDGRFYSYQGSCKYQLVADCVNHSFSIRVTNDGKQTKTSAWTKTVSIKIKDLKINLGQKKRVKVNGVRVTLPHVLKDGRGVINKTDEDFVHVTTHIGIRVLWDGSGFLEVFAATKYKSKLCGLCGNYNSIVRDDFTTRRGKIMNETEIWKFAGSWRVGGKKACTRDHDPKSRRLPDARKTRLYHQLCLPLMIGDNFGECKKKLNPEMYARACLTDMVECPIDRKCFCESFTAYAHECQRLNVAVSSNWRASTNCFSNSTSPLLFMSTAVQTTPKHTLIPPLHSIKRAHYMSHTVTGHLLHKSPTRRRPPPPLIS